MLEQQRLDEVRLQTVGARQAMRRDILRDVRVPERDVKEAVAILEDLDRRTRRVLGSGHPFAKDARGSLERTRQQLANFQEA